MNAPKPTLEMWHLRLLSMIEFEKERRKNEGSDIKKFIIRKKRRRRQRLPTVSPPEPKSYHQQTLWNTLQTENPTRIEPTPPATIIDNEMNTHKRTSIMENLVRKRKRQSQIIPTRITKNRKQENNNQVKQIREKSRKRPHTIRQPTHIKKKKAKKMKILPNRRKVSIRDLIRQAGKDPKTDR